MPMNKGAAVTPTLVPTLIGSGGLGGASALPPAGAGGAAGALTGAAAGAAGAAGGAALLAGAAAGLAGAGAPAPAGPQLASRAAIISQARAASRPGIWP